MGVLASGIKTVAAAFNSFISTLGRINITGQVAACLWLRVKIH